MSDIMQTAQNYHRHLTAEIAKIDEFFRLAEKLLSESAPEEYMPLTNSAPTPMPPKQRIEVQSLPLVSGIATAQEAASPQEATTIQATVAPWETAAMQAETAPASRKNGRGSLFRGAFEPCEIDRQKIVV